MYESVAKFPCGEVTVAKLPCGEVTGNRVPKAYLKKLKVANFLVLQTTAVPVGLMHK